MKNNSKTEWLVSAVMVVTLLNTIILIIKNRIGYDTMIIVFAIIAGFEYIGLQISKLK